MVSADVKHTFVGDKDANLDDETLFGKSTKEGVLSVDICGDVQSWIFPSKLAIVKNQRVETTLPCCSEDKIGKLCIY